MSSSVQVYDSEPEYTQSNLGTDDLPIDVEATPATRQSYENFRASTGAIVSPKTLLDQIVPLPHAYTPNIPLAIGAGLLATILFTICWYPLYFGYHNTSMDLAMLLGSYVVPGPLGWMTRLVGFFMHLGVGAALGVGYAMLLYVLRTQSHAGKGTLYGAGIFFFMSIWVLPWVAPMAVYGASGAHFDSVSPFLEWVGANDQGWNGFAFGLIAHLIYGSILGALYRAKRTDHTRGIW